MTEIDQKALEAAISGDYSAHAIITGLCVVTEATIQMTNGPIKAIYQLQLRALREAETALAATPSNAAETAKPVAWRQRYIGTLKDYGGEWHYSGEDPHPAMLHPDEWQVEPLYAAPPPLSTSSGEDRAPKYLAPISTDGLRTIAEGQFGVGDPELVQQIAREALATREMSK